MKSFTYHRDKGCDFRVERSDFFLTLDFLALAVSSDDPEVSGKFSWVFRWQ